MDILLQRVNNDGVFFLFVDSTRAFRAVWSRISALIILFMYVQKMYSLGYYLIFIIIASILLFVYYLHFFRFVVIHPSNLYPIFYAWAPMGLFCVHGDRILFPFSTPKSPDLYLPEEKLAVDSELYILHILNIIFLLLLILYYKHCNLCTYPYYMLAISWEISPDATTRIGPWILSIISFLDGIHHYASHHVHQFPFAHFAKVNAAVLVIVLLIGGTYSVVSTFIGVLIALALNVYPARTFFEKFLDPESILGVQLAFALGQLAVTLLTKLYFPDINGWDAVLKGLVLGRTVLMFTIQDEINRKIPLGKLRLF